MREEHAEELRHLRESAVDYYAALRSAFLFDREGEIRERIDPQRSELSLPAAAAASAVSTEQPGRPPPAKATTASDADATPVAPPFTGEVAAPEAAESAPQGGRGLLIGPVPLVP